MKAKEVMELYNISRPTLNNWVKSGKIDYETLPSGRYNYLHKRDLNEIKDKKTVLYARVSTQSQKENLERQIERLKSFTTAQGFIVDHVYKEVASALNYERKEYKKLLSSILNGEVERVIVEYKDRLLRFGFDEFKFICESKNVELIVVDKTQDNKTAEQEMTEDLVSIIHHFSSKLYSKRKRNKLINIVNEK